jgi:hypothetical protein
MDRFALKDYTIIQTHSGQLKLKGSVARLSTLYPQPLLPSREKGGKISPLPCRERVWERVES